MLGIKALESSCSSLAGEDEKTSQELYMKGNCFCLSPISNLPEKLLQMSGAAHQNLLWMSSDASPDRARCTKIAILETICGVSLGCTTESPRSTRYTTGLIKPNGH